MIAGSQYVNEGLIAGAMPKTRKTEGRKRGCRLVRQIKVRFLSADEFEVAIFFELERQHCPAPHLALHEIEELLALA